MNKGPWSPILEIASGLNAWGSAYRLAILGSYLQEEGGFGRHRGARRRAAGPAGSPVRHAFLPNCWAGAQSAGVGAQGLRKKPRSHGAERDRTGRRMAPPRLLMAQAF